MFPTDHSAFSHFWTTVLHPIIQAYFRIRRLSPGEVHDLIMTVYERLAGPTQGALHTRENLLALHDQGDMDHVEAIVRTIARRVLLDDAQHCVTEETYLLRYAYRQPAPTLPEDDFDRVQLAEVLNKILPTIRGGVELLMSREGLSLTEIQLIVGAPTPAAVGKRIARALEILREHPELQQYAPPK